LIVASSLNFVAFDGLFEANSDKVGKRVRIVYSILLVKLVNKCKVLFLCWSDMQIKLQPLCKYVLDLVSSSLKILLFIKFWICIFKVGEQLLYRTLVFVLLKPVSS